MASYTLKKYPRHSFNAIAKITGIKVTTVKSTVKNYLLRGHLFELGKNNRRKVPDIPEDLKTYLLIARVLFEWQGDNLLTRVPNIKQLFGFCMSTFRLRTFYRQNGLRYGKPDVLFDRALA